MSNARRILAVLCLFTFIPVCNAWALDMGVKGRVVDSESRPVAGAKVYACAMRAQDRSLRVQGETLTNERGDFEFERVRLGGDDMDYATLYATKRGLAWGSMYARPDVSRDNTIVLLPPGRLAGRVVDHKGKPVGGAVVWAGGSLRLGDTMISLPFARGLSFLVATTDKAGAFALDDLPMGADCTLHVEARGYGECYFGSDAEGGGHLTVPAADVTVSIQPECIIKGTLRWEKTGKPVPGIPLRTDSGQPAITDENGAFAIRRLNSGEHSLFVQKPSSSEDLGGVLATKGPIKLGIGEVVKDLSLVWSEGTQVEGRLLDAGSKQPVSGANVHLYPGTESRLAPRHGTWARTQEDGGFRVRVSPGPYRMMIREQRYAMLQTTVTAGPGPVTRIGDVLISQLPVYRVEVKDEAGKPVGWARLLRGKSCIGTCDEEGKIELRAREPEPNALTWREYKVLSPNDDRIGALKAPDKEGEAIQVVVHKGGAITGIVQDAQGKPIKGAKVQLWFPIVTKEGIPGGGTSNGDIVITDAAGRYTFTGLVPELKVSIGVMADGFMGSDPYGGKKAYDIRPGVTTQADPVVLTAGEVTITGRVLGADGSPIRNAMVYVRGRRSKQRSQAFTDRDGRFKLSGILSEDVFITAQPIQSEFATVMRKFRSDELRYVEIVCPPEFDLRRTLEPGESAPEIKGVEWIQGGWEGFQAARGGRIAVAFVSIYVPACRKAIGDLMAARNQVSLSTVAAQGGLRARNLVSSGTQVVLVHDASATAEEIKQFLADKKIAWPVARVTDEKNSGWSSPAFVAYKVTSVPTVVCVGADGKVQGSGASGR